MVIALSGTVTNDKSKEPPNSPTNTKFPRFLKTANPILAVFGALTKSITLSAPLLLHNEMIFCAEFPDHVVTEPITFEFTTKSAPNSLAVSNLLSSKSTQIILDLVIALAICIPIRPRPPAPTITKNSG